MFQPAPYPYEGQYVGTITGVHSGAATGLLSTAPQPWGTSDGTMAYSAPPHATGDGSGSGWRAMDSCRQGPGRQRKPWPQWLPNRGCAPSVALNLLAPQPVPQSCGVVDPSQQFHSVVYATSSIGGTYVPATPPWLVQNTFVSTPMQRSPSLDGFYEERLVRSSPPSPPPTDRPELAGISLGFGCGDSQFMIPTPTGSEAGSMLLPPPNREPGLPVLRLSDVLAETAWCRAVPGEVGSNVDVWSSTDSTAAESNRGHFMNPRFDPNASCGASSAGSAEIHGMGHSYPPAETTTHEVGKPELGSPELPSRGSTLHRWGVCKPCAFVFQTCDNGVDCQFCHLCEPGERKRRKKDRLSLRREARAKARQQHFDTSRLGAQHRT